MKTALSVTLGWALNCYWLSANPCVRIRTPRQTGGRTVKRTVLKPQQIVDIVAKLEEPYATLVLFIAVTGLRIGEAIALKWSDFTGNVFHVTRRIYDRKEDVVKSKKGARKIPVDEKLIERMRALEHHDDLVFCSKAGTAVDPANALKRYVRPAVSGLGLSIGGWHDFRHTLSTKLRRSGVHPKVVSDILGHAKVSLAMDVYDQTNVEDFVEPLSLVFNELLPDVTRTSGND